jgi:hypothetical protein
MYEQRQKLYVANEETNQIFDESDITDVIAGWDNNWTTTEIAEYIGADRKEIELLLLDLIHKGKIAGNIHVFKRRKGKPPLIEIDMGENKIRAIHHDKQTWICVKDFWRHIGKPEHSYRKVTENWGPGERSKFQLETPSGRQHFIFINIPGLDKLCNHVEKNMLSEINRLKELIK